MAYAAAASDALEATGTLGRGQIETVAQTGSATGLARAFGTEGLIDHGEKLSTLLDTNCAMMRRGMMDFYREARAAFLTTQRNALDAERRSSAQHFQAKQDELESVASQLLTLKARSAKDEMVLMNAAELISRLNGKAREAMYLAAIFKDWRSEFRWRKYLRTMTAKAEMWRTSRLCRLAFSSWHTSMCRDMKHRVNERVAAAAAEASQQTEARKDAETAALRQTLHDTQQALAAEKEGRELLAQDMKRSFMRGVCALNMEAMQVMKRGLAPGGMNPNPSVFPVPHSDTAQGVSGPEPEAIPDNVQAMISSLATPTSDAAQASWAQPLPSQAAAGRSFSARSAYAVRAERARARAGCFPVLADESGARLGFAHYDQERTLMQWGIAVSGPMVHSATHRA